MVKFTNTSDTFSGLSNDLLFLNYILKSVVDVRMQCATKRVNNI